MHETRHSWRTVSCKRKPVHIISNDIETRKQAHLKVGTRGVSRRSIRAIWCILFALGAHTNSGAPSLQKRDGGTPTPEWHPSRHVDLPFFSLFVPFFPFFFFLFSFLSSFPFLFGAPLVTPGGRGRKAPRIRHQVPNKNVTQVDLCKLIGTSDSFF